MLWSVVRRSQISNIGNKNNSQISKLLGIEWLALPEKDKLYYKQKADEIKKQHMILNPDYKYKPKQKAKSNIKRKTTYIRKTQATQYKQCQNTAPIQPDQTQFPGIDILHNKINTKMLVKNKKVLKQKNVIDDTTNIMMEHIFDMIDYKHFSFLTL